MKGTWKKIMATIVTFVFVLEAAFALGEPVNAEAATKNYMKKVNVNWDLKKNKSVTFKTKYAGIGMKKQKAKITNYKIKNSKKKGYKELTFTLSFSRQWNVKASEVHKIANSDYCQKTGQIGAGCYYAIVDYNTGKTLEKENKYNVTVEKELKSQTPKYYYCYHQDGYYEWVCISNGSMEIKVTYPKNYKGLCIGIGGKTTLAETKNDTKFWNGKVPFGKTTYYSKKDKSIAHFMRVTK